LLCWSATLLSCQASEVRYNVFKIIEGSSTTAPAAGGINQKGQVVGSMDTSGGSGFWLWTDGVRQDLRLGTNRNCYVVGLNNQGQVVGSFHTGEFGVDSHGIVYPLYQAFVWTAGFLQDLGTLGGEVSFGIWINDQGVVLGAADTIDDRIPFIARNGQMRSLQSLILNPSGWKLALETHHVAADGRIWGLGTYGGKEHIYEMTPEPSEFYRISAFLWENGVMFNLNDLISPDSSVVLTESKAINDAGNIVCTYRNIASGFYGVCLLVPATPMPLEIVRHAFIPAGLQLEVQGGAGQPLAVEYTSDWAQWTTLATSTNLFGRRMFIDPAAGNATFRGYRARLVTP
jgi:uncharacterized membrane protein